MARFAMTMDTKKCVGCSDCVLACKNENQVPHGLARDWIVQEVGGRFPTLWMEQRSERCNHCEDPPCVYTCPTGASHVHQPGGVVLVTPNECIGCKACIAACPYDARYIHPEGYVSKCTFCIHRTSRGEQPSCVSVCPTYCLAFGDLDDPDSEVSQLLASRKHKVLLPEAGTEPKMYFLY